jgi:hypothetical protein
LDQVRKICISESLIFRQSNRFLHTIEASANPCRRGHYIQVSRRYILRSSTAGCSKNVIPCTPHGALGCARKSGLARTDLGSRKDPQKSGHTINHSCSHVGLQVWRRRVAIIYILLVVIEKGFSMDFGRSIAVRWAEFLIAGRKVVRGGRQDKTLTLPVHPLGHRNSVS